MGFGVQSGSIRFHFIFQFNGSSVADEGCGIRLAVAVSTEGLYEYRIRATGRLTLGISYCHVQSGHLPHLS
jgi:hypothetical protein